MQASAHGIEGANLTILNGSGGVNDVATGLAAQGLSIYQALRTALGTTSNGRSSNGGGATESDEEPRAGNAAPAA